jgi:phosphohistidine phosphatase
MELLIVRHAIAFERDRSRWSDDTRRPLTQQGIRRAKQAAAGLRELVDAPDRLFTSPLVRARQTAAILTQFARWPEARETSTLAPGTAVADVLTLLANDAHRRIAVVGHQPELGILLSACLLSEQHRLRVQLKKHSVACVGFSGRVRPGHGTLEWLATPRMLRALRVS